LWKLQTPQRKPICRLCAKWVNAAQRSMRRRFDVIKSLDSLPTIDEEPFAAHEGHERLSPYACIGSSTYGNDGTRTR
jgi:hypothetical protein